MRLGDVARTEDHAGNAAPRQHRRIAEIMQPFWSRPAEAPLELTNERQTRIRLQRKAGFQFHIGNLRRQFSRAEKGGKLASRARLRFARQRAPVHVDHTTIGNNIRLRAAGNRADIHRAGTEQWMAPLARPE